jgi:hypothetical protein
MMTAAPATTVIAIADLTLLLDNSTPVFRHGSIAVRIVFLRHYRRSSPACC